MGKAKPLTDQQRLIIQEKMTNSLSLADVTKDTGSVNVVEYLLEDQPRLEEYLIAMAAKLTQQRQQISHSALILSVFHYEMGSLSLYGQEFANMLIVW